MGKPKWYNWVAPITNLARKEGDPKTGDSIPLTPDKEPWQLDTGKKLAEWAQKYLEKYEPGKAYTGERTAPMTGFEGRSLELLDSFIGKPATGSLYDQAAGEVSRTLSEGYDPFKDPYYQSIREASKRELEDQVELSRRGAASRGSYFTEGAMRDESRLAERNLGFLNSVLGELGREERERRFRAVPLAQGLEGYKRSQELGQIEAGQRYGSLERLIEQSDMEARYQDFLRQQQELSGVPGVGQGVFGTPITYGMKEIPMPAQPSTFERILGAAAPLVGAAAGTFLAPGVGTALGAQAGSQLSNIMAQPQDQSFSSIARLRSSPYYMSLMGRG